MYKNQLQELAQRSCFNLPSYTCIRVGPDHAPRFKVAVNFNGETFESPSYCSTLRQAEHSAAEMALNALANRGPSNSLAARILDETGVYKNLLQEVSQRVGATLPVYTTFRTGLGHLPVFTCTVELAGVVFTGEPAKNKKQAEKNAAMEAWLSLKSLAQQSETPYEKTLKDEQEHVTVARALQKYLIKAKLARASFPIKFPTLSPRPSSTLPPPSTTSKILPLICPKVAQGQRPVTSARSSPAFQAISRATQTKPIAAIQNDSNVGLVDNLKPCFQMPPAAGAAPYIPVRCSPRNRVALPVTIRNAMPVFSAPPRPSAVIRPPALGMAPPVSLRHAVPVFSAPLWMEELPRVHCSIKAEDPWTRRSLTARVEEPPISKLHPIHVDEPLGPKLLTVSATQTSEVPPAVQIELPSPKVLSVSGASPLTKVSGPSDSSNVPAEDSKIEEAHKLPDSIDIVILEYLNV